MGGGAGNDGESQGGGGRRRARGFLGLKSASIVRTRRMKHMSEERLEPVDKFGVVTTISKEANTPGQSRGFAIMTNSEPQTGESRNRGLGNALANPEVDNEKDVEAESRGPDLDQHEATRDRQGYTATSDATRG